MKNNIQEKNKNYYIQIADWMLEFNLPVNLLLTYAIVYGYCQSGENCYYGSVKTMAELLGIRSGGHAAEYLNALEKKGLLRKEFVKTKGKQKLCKYYVTTSISGRVDEQNIDYITIQPWMFKTLKLKNNDLLIYARIQNLSRSNNFYFLSYSDLAKWASCKERKIRGYINELLKKKVIEYTELAEQEGYKAIIPNNISNTQKWSTLPKSGVPLPKTGVPLPKSGNNNLIYNLNNINNNIINNNITSINTSNSKNNIKKSVVEEKELKSSYRSLQDEVTKHFETSLTSSKEYQRYLEAGQEGKLFFLDAMNRLISLVNKQNKSRLLKCLKLTKDQIEELWTETSKTMDDYQKSFINPEGWIISRLNNMLD